MSKEHWFRRLHNLFNKLYYTRLFIRSQLPRGVKRESAASRLLDYRFEFHRRHWYLSLLSVVLLGRALCEGPIALPEESYRMCYAWEWFEASIIRRSWTIRDCCTMGKKCTSLHFIWCSYRQLLCYVTLRPRRKCKISETWLTSQENRLQ